MRTASGSLVRACYRNCAPVISGMRMSEMIASTCCSSSSFSPSAPPSAVCTVKPRERNVRRSAETMFGSSSTASTEKPAPMASAMKRLLAQLSLAHPRQDDSEARALARRAAKLDAAVVLLHDRIGHRQAEPGALAHRLGGEEGLEDAR